MDTLAYTHLCTSYEEALDPNYQAPELILNWNHLPSSAWLGFLGVAFLFSGLNIAESASAAQYYVRTNGSCLNARTRPSASSPVYSCVRNGAALAPVVSVTNGWARLSTGRYVSSAYISTSPGGRPGNPGPGVGGRALRLGSRGQAVRDVQIALGTRADGVYGPNTRSAVISFQQRAGLRVDGIVGPQTRRALFS